MTTGLILLLVGAFYFAAHLLSYIFQKTLIPDVLILILVGIFLGPLTGIASVEDFGQMGNIMIIIALTVVLFESGTTLKVSSLASCMGSTLSVTLLTSIATILVIAAGTAPLFGGDWSLALLTGTILSGTSSAIVIPMVQSLKVSERPATVLVMESALTDVTCIIGAFAILNSVEGEGFGFGGIVKDITSSLILAVSLGIALGLAWSFFWNKIRQLPDSVFSTVAFTFVIYGVAELFGASGAISVLAFGITLANAPLVFKDRALPQISEMEHKFFREIVFILRTFFFVFLGISVQFSGAGIFVVGALVVLLLYFLRVWITRFTLGTKGTTREDASIVAIMIPKGLAPAVLASVIAQRQIPGGETVQAIVFSVVILSIILTAALVPLVRKGKVQSFYATVLSPFQSAKEAPHGSTPPQS
jgi:cell volume regulation protein A